MMDINTGLYYIILNFSNTFWHYELESCIVLSASDANNNIVCSFGHTERERGFMNMEQHSCHIVFNRMRMVIVICVVHNNNNNNNSNNSNNIFKVQYPEYIKIQVQ